MLSHEEALIRIAVGTVLGATIGYERNLHRRPVGLRTHLLVALASSMFMILSTQFAFYQHFEKGGLIEVDASRIAASVVSAVGFLGGGAILRSGLTIQGMTTAAGMWLVTAIGMCAGAGMFVEAVFGTVLGLVALSLLRRLEDKGQKFHCRLSVHADESEPITDLMQQLERSGAHISQVEVRRPLHKGARTVIELDMTRPERTPVVELLRELEKRPGLHHVQIQRRN